MKRSFLVLIVTLVFSFANTNVIYGKSFNDVIDPDDPNTVYTTSRIIEDVIDPGGGTYNNPPDIFVDTTSFNVELFSQVDYPSCTGYDQEDGHLECTLISNVDNEYAGDYSFTYEVTDSERKTTSSDTVFVTVIKSSTNPFASSGIFVEPDEVLDYVFYAGPDNVISHEFESFDNKMFFFIRSHRKCSFKYE